VLVKDGPQLGHVKPVVGYHNLAHVPSRNGDSPLTANPNV